VRHATAGLCGSNIRARITLLMRRDDSLLEIVLGVQINLAHPVMAQLRKPKPAHASRSQRPTLHLSKIPPACAVGGSRMIVSSQSPSRGCSARTPDLRWRCSYWPICPPRCGYPVDKRAAPRGGPLGGAVLNAVPARRLSRRRRPPSTWWPASAAWGAPDRRSPSADRAPRRPSRDDRRTR